jgi:hypothetical protein
MLSGNLRHQIFRAAIELPGMANYFRLRSSTTHRNFEASSYILMQQLSLVESLSSFKNSMLPMLLANTQFVMRQTQLRGEAQALLPYLERLAAYQKDIFIVQVWFAEALLDVDPQKALDHAQIAQRLIPNDDRGYRIAIEAALKLNQNKLVEEQCAKYKAARLGSLHHYEYETLFHGVGVNKFGIEVDDGKGGSELIIRTGLSIGENIIYDFPLPYSVSFRDIHLHLGAMPGLGVAIQGIRMFRGGALVGNIEKDNITISARHGFVKAGVVYTISRDGELLILRFSNNETLTADRVDIKISLRRLHLLSGSACTK